MKTGIALVTVLLMAMLFGSAWMRRGEWELNGESGAMVLALLVSFAAVVLILLALWGLP